MRLFGLLVTVLLAVTAAVRAEVAELTALVPEAKNFELIAKFDPRTWSKSGYQFNRADGMEGDLKRVGYLVKLTDKSDKLSWVFVSVDSFAKTAVDALVPEVGGKVFQDYVNNLEIFSNVEGLKTGKFEKGNIEFWGNNYSQGNAKKIPGADDKTFDFGDLRATSGDYGSMQIHNYPEKQTVFAFNRHRAGAKCDLGIGNSPSGNPDWTFRSNGESYKTTEIYVVGEFDNLKISDVVRLNGTKVGFFCKTDANAVEYKVGQPISFSFDVDYQGQQPTMEYFVSWTRTGDDGKTEKGREPVVNGKAEMKTSLDRPGFVRVIARIVDKNDKALNNVRVFDGGAGVEIDKLAGSPEPEDFDAFWAKQKARLAEVPMKAQLEKFRTSTKEVNVYIVRIDCAGPRPVTGYLTVPAGAKEKSLPAHVGYHGYGVGRQGAPDGKVTNKITFSVNAHGYDLDRDAAYYPYFAGTIKSSGLDYAFDPKQNSDPEKAYFNGMALRLMRSLEYIKSLPEWNGKDLTVSGGSQGGLQSIWAAALDSDVSACESVVTWCCDLAGHEKMGRLTGPWRIKYVPALDYYDAVNHAKRVKCPVNISRAGLGDYVCPPSGLAVLYNNITAPKKITWYQNNGHGAPPKDSQTFFMQNP